MKPVIIIGAGLAGYTVAREFRKLEKTAPLLVVTADQGAFYSKPMLSNAFAQGKQAEQLVTQSVADMAAQLGASILSGTRAVAIDTAAKTLETSAGVFEYDKLVLAVGARPIRLPLNGNAADDVLSVNHIDDYVRLRRRIAEHGGSARVTILGAGLIGCEFADDLASAGHHVTVVDPNELPLSSLAAPALSRSLGNILAKRGVVFRSGTTAISVDRSDKALVVTLADGSWVDTDVVLSAVGLRADLTLAQAAGLHTSRGIMIDATGRTSAPDVYALGDCAEYTTDDGSRPLPYVAPLMTAARAIACTLAGQPTLIELKAAPVIVKTLSYPLALLPPPANAAAPGVWQESQYGERLICRYYDGNGTMVGFGVAPQDASTRQGLLAELGSVKISMAA